MPEEPQEIIAEIHHSRKSLDQHLSELEVKAEIVTDWRLFLRRNPQIVVTAALVATGLLSLMLFGRRHRRVTYNY